MSETSSQKQSPAKSPARPSDDKAERPSTPMRPENALTVDPEKAVFLDTGGRSEHMLANLGEQRIAVKIRCSDNKLFWVDPVYMFIDGGQCHNLIVTRHPGPPKTDKLVFQFVPCPETETDAKEFFKNRPSKPAPFSERLPITCVTRDDVPSVGPSTPRNGDGVEKAGKTANSRDLS